MIFNFRKLEEEVIESKDAPAAKSKKKRVKKKTASSEALDGETDGKTVDSEPLLDESEAPKTKNEAEETEKPKKKKKRKKKPPGNNENVT